MLGVMHYPFSHLLHIAFHKFFIFCRYKSLTIREYKYPAYT